MGFVIACCALVELGAEALFLLDGIVELAEGVADLEATDEELEAFDVRRVVGLGLREW